MSPPWIVALIASALGTGCLTIGVRARGGVVADKHGPEAVASLDLAVGAGPGNGGAIVAGFGAATGTAPPIGFQVALDYLRVAEEQVAWRAGFASAPVHAGEATTMLVRGALLFLVRDRHGGGASHPKIGISLPQRTVLGVGLELGAGGMVRREVPSQTEVFPAAGAALAVELYKMDLRK